MKSKVTVRKIWGVIYPMLIYVGVTYFVSIVYVIAFTVLLTLNGNYENQNELMAQIYEITNSQILMMTFVSAVLTIPLMIFFMHRDKNAEILNNRYKKYEQPFFLKYLLIVPFAIGCMYSANAFVAILTMLMPSGMVETYEATEQAIYGSSFVLQVLASGIFGPIVEELIFRGLIYNRIKRMSGITIAAVISSIIFGIFHGNWVQAPYAMIIGLVCVYVYERYKSIAAPILLHISANMCSLIMFFISTTVESDSTAVTMTFSEELRAYTIIMLFMGLIAYGISVIINKTVNPKEITP